MGIYFALSMIVFIGVIGLAVDISRGYLAKTRLSQAVDAAALAGGKALQTADDPLNLKVKGDALAFFNANLPDNAMGVTLSPPSITIGNNNTTVTVSSDAEVPTVLMRIFGMDSMKVAAQATVARAATGLDVVFAFDITGSMCNPCSKINALKRNSTALVDSLNRPFTSGIQSQFVTVNGLNYSLLNIGVVPWGAKVNVRSYGKEGGTGSVVAKTVGGYSDPTGQTAGNQSVVYYASSSEVPLLYDPSTLRGGWSGCVYARYTDDGDPRDDADLDLGAPVVANGKTWPAWEPIARDDGEPLTGRECNATSWNAGARTAQDGTQRPGGWPDPPVPLHNDECTSCPRIGILPLQSNPEIVKSMIDHLQANGATMAPQGLFWAWEVLMPGEPFDEAALNPPFQRAQAIVFMTDGLNEGSNGDAYHGWFGEGPPAGNITSKGDMIMPDGSMAKNNPDNRLLAMAARIKGPAPREAAAIKIYVIQYRANAAKLTGLLKAVATEPNAPYYYYAPDDTSLARIFDEIAASLSALRIVQ